MPTSVIVPNNNKIIIKPTESSSLGQLFKSLKTSQNGLTGKEATSRIEQYGYNQIVATKEKALIIEFLSKFANPLTLSLIIVAVISFFLGQQVDSIIIILMAVLSVVFSFVQERSAAISAKKLNELVKVTVFALRDGKKISVPLKDIVPGDIIELSAGKMVPADARIISSNSLHVSQSALTGESFPVDKSDAETATGIKTIFDSPNLIFMGSNVVGGAGMAVVTKTGGQTEFGKLSHDLIAIKKETSFDKGIKNFTKLMIKLIFVLVLFIFVSNFVLKGNFTESLLFALAVAIGITPEMLPMVITINLSKGAMDIAKKKVIIKELSSIQNFGAMDILCTDKTGTLTNDQVALVNSYNCREEESEEVLEMTYLNSYFQEGLENVLDKAVLDYKKIDVRSYKKLDELPYDFSRRILSVIVSKGSTITLVAKGAPEEIVKRAKYYEADGKKLTLDQKAKKKLLAQYESLSGDGFRVLAVASKVVEYKKAYDLKDESDLIIKGFVAFLDPPKASAKLAIDKLEALGISLKVLSGDNELVTEKIASEIKLPILGTLTADQIDRMDDKKLANAVEKANLFTRLTPVQKERIIKALQANKHIVGFLGDGINDSPSLKTADVGISVNNATDIAKETAEIILLEKDLKILADCVTEGRKTFANTTKYIKMGASSNFGNMLSMTGASLFLPFLPMLPAQILLNNFLYDVSQVAIPTDNVDQDLLETPRPWDIKFIKQFIIYFGPVSSLFDFITFIVMIYVFHASQSMFHTGWFVESLLTQTFVVYIIRTRKIPFLESRPSKALLFTTLAIVLFGVLLPYLPIAGYLGFDPLPALFFVILAVIAFTYLLLTQLIKVWFTKKYGYE
jgi:Mg2+-importing ATPase